MTLEMAAGRPQPARCFPRIHETSSRAPLGCGPAAPASFEAGGASCERDKVVHFGTRFWNRMKRKSNACSQRSLLSLAEGTSCGIYQKPRFLLCKTQVPALLLQPGELALAPTPSAGPALLLC